MTRRPRRLPAAALALAAIVLPVACGPRFPDTTEQAGGTRATVGPGAGTEVDTTAPGTTLDPGTAGPATPGAPATRGSATPRAGAAAPGTTVAGGQQVSATVEPGPAPGVTDDEIKIGYLLPLTGAAPVPSSFDEGANVYWNYVNARGGINGRRVRVLIRDTQSRADVGKQEAERLIEEGVFAFVVLDRLENQQAIGAYLDSRQVPNIEIQTPVNLSKDQRWTFGVTIDHGVQGALIADYFVKVLRASRVAVVYENTPVLEPGKNAFAERAQALGATVSYTKSIDGKGNDFSGEALALSRSGATATWLYMAPEPAAKLVNQADAVGYHPTWFANSISWNFDLVFAVAPKALAGARAFSPWLPLSHPRTNTYKQAYREQNGREGDDLGIVGWGVGQIVGEGLRRAGHELGQNRFRDAMQHLRFQPDVWAPLAFDEGVRQGADVVCVLREQGGRWVLERDFTAQF